MRPSELWEVLRSDESGWAFGIGAGMVVVVLLAVQRRPVVTIRNAGAVAVDGGRVVVGAAVGRHEAAGSAR
jgi:hypothetical protein